MQIRLSIRRSGSALVYGIPRWYRIVSWAIALVLVAASAFSGGFGAPGLVIVAVAALAALYQERWTFDAEADACSGRMGLLFAAKGPDFKASDVARLRIDVFAKGRLDQGSLPPADKMPYGSQARLVLDTKSGDSYMLDSVPFRRRADLESTALLIAEELGVPLGD
ncbi:MAG: hypothetical protein KKA67_10810 [Spirochaetes bacterium]|nr:hypothetical protein [Spirochaetota bacterium]MBU1080684.1 hypothetical protein [Spirochaetota bacterium]